MRVEERFLRRYAFLADEPYPFDKAPAEPYHLPHGGHIDWLLAATGVGRLASVEGLLLGEHDQETWAKGPPRQLTLQGPGVSAGDLKAWLEESWEYYRRVGYLGFEIRDPASGLNQIRQVLCLWVVYRGRAPWAEPFLRDFEPTGVWKVEPPHLWYAKLASALERPAMRGYPDLAVTHVWEVVERVDPHPDALYIAFWRLREPWDQPQAEELLKLLNQLARAANAESDPSLTSPGFLMPLFCGSLLVVDGWHFPVDRRRYGFSNLPVGRAYSLVQVRVAVRHALKSRPHPASTPQWGSSAAQPAEPLTRLPPRLAAAVSLLAGLGFSPAELESIAGALGLGPSERKALLEAAAPVGPAGSGSVELFIRVQCVFRDDLKVRALDLYRAYVEWCREGGLSPLTQQAFGRAIRRLGVVAYRQGRTGRVFYRGIGLRSNGR